MDVVKGESVRWTKSSRSLDTRPLRVFIIKSIHSLIICISATMWGGTMSAVDGWLTSDRSSLLGALLPSGPSWYLLSTLVPSWSSFWVLCPAFLWRSCSSRSWFGEMFHCSHEGLDLPSQGSGSQFVSLNVVGGCLKRVSTMQLYVWEAIVWLIFLPIDDANWWCQKNHQWATQSLHARNNTCIIKREDLIESTGMVSAKYPPKVKLELLTTLEY